MALAFLDPAVVAPADDLAVDDQDRADRDAPLGESGLRLVDGGLEEGVAGCWCLHLGDGSSRHSNRRCLTDSPESRSSTSESMPISRCGLTYFSVTATSLLRGLDPLGGHRAVRDQEQGPLGDVVDEADDEDRRRLHVDARGPALLEVSLERVVVLPDAAVRGVDGAGPVVEPVLDDRGRDGLLQPEGGEGGDLGGEVVVARPLAPDRGDRQDVVADLDLRLQAPALAQEEDGLRAQGGEQVHDGRRHGAPHAEVQDGDVLGGRRLHRPVAAQDLDAEPLGEQLDVVDEVAQQHVPAERAERPPGVAGQPVLDDLVLGSHDNGPSSDSRSDSTPNVTDMDRVSPTASRRGSRYPPLAVRGEGAEDRDVVCSGAVGVECRHASTHRWKGHSSRARGAGRHRDGGEVDERGVRSRGRRDGRDREGEGPPACRRCPEHWRSLPRVFVRQARALSGQPAMADSTGASLTYGQALLRALALGRVLARTLGPSPNVGLLIPPTVPSRRRQPVAGALGEGPDQPELHGEPGPGRLVDRAERDHARPDLGEGPRQVQDHARRGPWSSSRTCPRRSRLADKLWAAAGGEGSCRSPRWARSCRACGATTSTRRRPSSSRRARRATRRGWSCRTATS